MTEQLFVKEQFWLSTTEQESMIINEYFKVDSDPLTHQNKQHTYTLSDGVYRVIDGELFRLVPGTPF